jgi:hypothetical protein
MIYLRQSLKIAAYECARLAIVPGVTEEDVQAQCDAILPGRKIENYTMTCNPPDPTTVKLGQHLTIEVQAPATEAAIIGSWFYQGKVLSESVTIMGEVD